MANGSLNARVAPVVVLAVGLGVLGYLGVVKLRPTIEAPRDVVAATPSLAGLISRTDVAVPAGRTLCVRPIPLDTVTRRVAVSSSSPVDVASLKATLSTPSERRRAVTISAAADGRVVAQFESGAASARAQFCLHNGGRRAVELVGTDEGRSQSVADAYVSGRRAGTDIALTMLGGRTTLRQHFAKSAANASVMSSSAISGWALVAMTVVTATLMVALVPAVAGAFFVDRHIERK